MSVGRKMAGVGATQIVEFGLQLLTPVVLVRVLEADVFAAYRWVWLLAGTVAAIAPLGMIVSLFYYLPKAESKAKLQYITQTLVHLLMMALLMVGAAWLLRQHLPGETGLFAAHGPWLVSFTVAWVVGMLLDQLPTADERVRWQMALSIGLAVVRSAALVFAAWHWQTLEAILYVLCAFVLLKLALMAFYVARYHRHHDWQKARLTEHLGHAWPLGFGTVLFGLRRQSEQWLVAALFSPLQFAAFSIAATLAPVMVMARKSVGLVLMPSMSRSQGRGDLQAMLKTNQQGNLVVSAFMGPMLAVVAVYADVLVGWVYTTQYLDAANVLRVFVVLWLLQMIDMNALVVMLKEGAYLSKVNFPLLALSVTVSYLGAKFFGLPGAALGSVLATYVERILLAKQIAKRVGISIYAVQPWLKTGSLALLSLALVAASRYALDRFGVNVVYAMVLVAALASGVGFILAKRYMKGLGHEFN
ncbi:oligosaccharide flippase family protein [Aquabacterium sp. A3]|uniref:lipopolysaccharide biosynthesis protein n=1 Tax=Aquabacterium sp. A3 TaxID=3132829 RepID=UPI0031197784